MECDEERNHTVYGKVSGMPASESRTLEISRLLQPLSIPEWKWELVTMDFFKALPRSPKGNNAIWVVVDCLMKSTHLIHFIVGSLQNC